MKKGLLVLASLALSSAQLSYAEETTSTQVDCAAVAGDSEQKPVESEADKKEKAAKKVTDEAAKAK